MRTIDQILEDMYAGDPDRIVPNCVISVDGQEVHLHPAIAQMRNTVLAARQLDREAYCDLHNIDETRWTGCHGCEGTGYHMFNRLPCWCDMGRIRDMQAKREEERETESLRRRWNQIKDESAA